MEAVEEMELWTAEPEVVVAEVEEIHKVKVAAPGSLGKDIMALLMQRAEVTCAVEAVEELTRWEDEVAAPVVLLINQFLGGVLGKRRP